MATQKQPERNGEIMSLSQIISPSASLRGEQETYKAEIIYLDMNLHARVQHAGATHGSCSEHSLERPQLASHELVVEARHEKVTIYQVNIV